MDKQEAQFEMGLVAAAENGDAYCYPCSLVVLPDGKLMTSFTKVIASGPNKGRAGGCVCSSLDHGKSWTKPEVLFFDDSPFISPPTMDQDFGDPSICVFPDKVVIYCQSVDHIQGRPDLSCSREWFRISYDYGLSWSPVNSREFHRKYYAGTKHAGLTLHDDSVIRGYSWDFNAENGIHTDGEGDQIYYSGLLKTTDGGEHWIPQPDLTVKDRSANAKPYAIQGAGEPAYVELADGSLYMLLRTGTERLWETRSYDCGLSWQDPVPSELVSHNCPAALLRASDGDIVVIYNDHPLERAKLCVRASSDGCRTWSKPKVFAPAESVNEPEASYPVICQLDNGLFVAVWGQVMRNREDNFKIYYARFNKEWIIRS